MNNKQNDKRRSCKRIEKENQKPATSTEAPKSVAPVKKPLASKIPKSAIPKRIKKQHQQKQHPSSRISSSNASSTGSYLPLLQLQRTNSIQENHSLCTNGSSTPSTSDYTKCYIQHELTLLKRSLQDSYAHLDCIFDELNNFEGSPHFTEVKEQWTSLMDDATMLKRLFDSSKAKLDCLTEKARQIGCYF
uniref:Uncharacterized protein n=1 Tax=Anopheles funestus TaxID=62324 RepID=A0A182S3I0_ANOFN